MQTDLFQVLRAEQARSGPNSNSPRKTHIFDLYKMYISLLLLQNSRRSWKMRFLIHNKKYPKQMLFGPSRSPKTFLHFQFHGVKM
jgi:hypothetical protein